MGNPYSRTNRNAVLPDGFGGYLRRRLAAGAGIGLILLSGLVLLAILSFDPADPSFNRAIAGPVSNLLGVPGAYVADMLLQSLGVMGVLVPVVTGVWGWRLFDCGGLRQWWFRLSALLSALLLGAAAAAAVPPTGWPVVSGLGGVGGDLMLALLSAPFSALFGGFGRDTVALAALGGAGVLTVYAFGLSAADWRRLAARTAAAVRRGGRWSADRVRVVGDRGSHAGRSGMSRLALWWEARQVRLHERSVDHDIAEALGDEPAWRRVDPNAALARSRAVPPGMTAGPGAMAPATGPAPAMPPHPAMVTPAAHPALQPRRAGDDGGPDSQSAAAIDRATASGLAGDWSVPAPDLDDDAFAMPMMPAAGLVQGLVFPPATSGSLIADASGRAIAGDAAAGPALPPAAGDFSPRPRSWRAEPPAGTGPGRAALRETDDGALPPPIDATDHDRDEGSMTDRRAFPPPAARQPDRDGRSALWVAGRGQESAREPAVEPAVDIVDWDMPIAGPVAVPIPDLAVPGLVDADADPTGEVPSFRDQHRRPGDPFIRPSAGAMPEPEDAIAAAASVLASNRMPVAPDGGHSLLHRLTGAPPPGTMPFQHPQAGHPLQEDHPLHQAGVVRGADPGRIETVPAGLAAALPLAPAVAGSVPAAGAPRVAYPAVLLHPSPLAAAPPETAYAADPPVPVAPGGLDPAGIGAPAAGVCPAAVAPRDATPASVMSPAPVPADPYAGSPELRTAYRRVADALRGVALTAGRLAPAPMAPAAIAVVPPPPPISPPPAAPAPVAQSVPVMEPAPPAAAGPVASPLPGAPEPVALPSLGLRSRAPVVPPPAQPEPEVETFSAIPQVPYRTQIGWRRDQPAARPASAASPVDCDPAGDGAPVPAGAAPVPPGWSGAAGGLAPAWASPMVADAADPASVDATPAPMPDAIAAPDPDGTIQVPPTRLLEAPMVTDYDGRPTDPEVLRERAEQLEMVLQDFGIRGEIVNARPGPVVTLFELEPAPGIRASRVIGLADDIARSMSALSVRIAVVPGQTVIGIELPNPQREMVHLRALLEHQSYVDDSAKLPLTLGKDIGGVPVVVDLARMPHLLIAGTTGSGKSVAVNAMILSLLFKLGPDRCRFIMVDPKMLELSIYNDIPQLLAPVVTDPKKAVVALKWAVREMEDRYKSMSLLGVRNIDGYNARIAEAAARGETLSRKVQTGFDPETGGPIYEEQPLAMEPLPFIVIVVDEMADLMLVAGKEIEAAIQRLAQMARAAGIHLIMATQRPSVDVITGTIKANFPTRISFQVTSKIDSRTILAEQGAEQLLGQGDMLYMAGGGRIRRIHGPFVSDGEVEQVTTFLKAQGGPHYVEGVTDEESDIAAAAGAAGGDDDGDELYGSAVAVVVRERKASTSFIQRHLQIGYNRAARIIERMEREGVVGAANHVGKREVLWRRSDLDGSSAA